MSIAEAAASGDRRKLLVALRDKVAEAIDNGVNPRDLVGLSRRLLDLAEELRAYYARDQPQLGPVTDDAAFDPSAV